MNDMRTVIVPKSDQMNADDLLAGPVTITIREVGIRPGTEQPVSIHYDGDNGKPWKPCKSMCRVLVAAWGPDAKAYVGRSATLYCDPKVKWGGMDVGGIRISHLSHIDRDMVMALTATKGKRAPFVVKPMAAGKPSMAIDDDAILRGAREAAKRGKDALNAYREELSPSDRSALQAHRAELLAIMNAGSALDTIADPLTAARATLEACKTIEDLDAAWDALDVGTCRALGADFIDELRIKLGA